MPPLNHQDKLIVSARVLVVGGWCGNLLYIVADHIRALTEKAGLDAVVKTFSVWDSLDTLPSSDLIIQLLPALKQEDLSCPLINGRPLLADLENEPVNSRILMAFEELKSR